MIDIQLPGGVWRYDDKKPLGPAGGFGAVFAGADLAGKPVAVKRLHIGAPEAAHRELTIARDLANRSYRHVMPILDAGQDANSDGYFVVMPVADESLQDRLQKRGAFPDGEVLIVLQQLIAGLEEANHIVHRDLKPANVLWHDSRWKIADYGIARFVEDSTSTRTLKECLSPYYAAPEQWRLETASGATDIYAAGCIAFALLTGQPPFVGPLDQVRDGHLHRAPPSVPTTNPQLRALVGMMLRKSPAARPTRARVGDVTANASQQDGKNRSNSPLSGLAAAAAAHEYALSAAEAEQARQRAKQTARAGLVHDARMILNEIATEFETRIGNAVPTASVSRESSVLVIRIGSGKLELELDPRAYRETDFPRSKWDVICGSAIGVAQAAPVHQRSASLWFTRQSNRQGEYRWYEVGYMGNPLARRGFQFQPTAVEAEAADRAHSLAVDVVQVCYPPVPIDGEDSSAFCNRWLHLLLAACEGRLQNLPSSLPHA